MKFRPVYYMISGWPSLEKTRAVTEIFHFILVAGENGVNTNFLTEITETLQSVDAFQAVAK